MNIDKILDERGSNYGNFKTHAEVTMKIKQSLYHALGDKEIKAYQLEALDMIAHKLGRIVNGDPNYIDSWVDIAGYAQLVVKELQIINE